MTDLSQAQPPPQTSADDASMKDKAGEAAQAAKQAGGEVAGTAADKAKEVAQETKRQARDLIGETRGQLSDQVGTQHQNLVSNLRSLADELSGMRENGQGGLAGELVGQAGDRARGVAQWLDGRQPGEVLDQVRSYARQHPGTFLIGAALAGVAVGRLTRGVVATHTEGPAGPAANDGSIDTGSTTYHSSYSAAPVAEPDERGPSVGGYSTPSEHVGLPTAPGGGGYGGVTRELPTDGAAPDAQRSGPVPGTPQGLGGPA